MRVGWWAVGRTIVVGVLAGLLSVPVVASATEPPPGVSVTTEPSGSTGDQVAAAFVIADSLVDVTPGRVSVTVEQVEEMTAEVEAGSGVLGVDLDEVAPMPEGAPAFSYLIAAWLHDAATQRAAVAAGWYRSDTDWSAAPSITYPRAVILMFVADVAEQADAALPEPPADQTFRLDIQDASTIPAGWRAGQVGDACAIVSGFFTTQVANLFNMLRLSPNFLGGGVLGFVGGIVATLWNTAIGLVGDAVQGLVRNLGEPVLQAIGKALAVAGLVSHVSTYITGWRIELDAEPEQERFAVGVEADRRGSFVVGDRSESRPWQGDLERCAVAFGVRVPRVLDPGGELRWEVVENSGSDGAAPMIVGTTRDDVIPDGARPRFGYVTSREPSDDGPLRFGRATVTVRVPRSELNELLNLAQKIVDDTIAGIVAFAIPVPALADEVRGRLRELVQPTIDQLSRAITDGTRSVFELTGSAFVMVTYHGPPEPTTTPPAPTTVPRPAPPAPTDVCALVPGSAVTAAVGPGGEGFIEIWQTVPGPPGFLSCGWDFDGFSDDAGALVRVATDPNELVTVRTLIAQQGLPPMGGLGWPAYGSAGGDDLSTSAGVIVDLGTWILQVYIEIGDPAFAARLDSAVAIAQVALANAGA